MTTSHAPADVQAMIARLRTTADTSFINKGLTVYTDASVMLVDLLAEVTALREKVAKDGGWRCLIDAPQDGTEIEILVRHRTWQYARTDKERALWQGPCRAKWIDHNGGGWTWSGHAGAIIAWRPLLDAALTNSNT
jgi:hypothetical protein